jgi:ribosomal protein S18 acetylase RimI-like enzyme
VLAVAPGFQRRGVGRALVQACVDAASARGHRRIVCSCLGSMTAAQALYAHCGFRRAPERDYALFAGYERQALVLDLGAGTG